MSGETEGFTVTEDQFYAAVSTAATTTPAWADAVCVVLDRIRNSARDQAERARRRGDVQGEFAHGNRAQAAMEAIHDLDRWYSCGARTDSSRDLLGEHMQTAKLVYRRDEVWTAMQSANERLAHNCRTCWEHDVAGCHNVGQMINAIEFAMQGVPRCAKAVPQC